MVLVRLPFPFIGMGVVIAENGAVFQPHYSSMERVLQHTNATHFAAFEKIAYLQINAISAQQTPSEHAARKSDLFDRNRVLFHEVFELTERGVVDGEVAVEAYPV